MEFPIIHYTSDLTGMQSQVHHNLIKMEFYGIIGISFRFLLTQLEYSDIIHLGQLNYSNWSRTWTTKYSIGRGESVAQWREGSSRRKAVCCPSKFLSSVCFQPKGGISCDSSCKVVQAVAITIVCWGSIALAVKCSNGRESAPNFSRANVRHLA